VSYSMPTFVFSLYSVYDVSFTYVVNVCVFIASFTVWSSLWVACVGQCWLSSILLSLSMCAHYIPVIVCSQ